MRVTTTVETDHIEQVQPVADAPHLLTLRVPVADVDVLAWWEAQDDPSVSFRTLVREDVRVHGVSDTVNRPITPASTASALARLASLQAEQRALRELLDRTPGGAFV